MLGAKKSSAIEGWLKKDQSSGACGSSRVSRYTTKKFPFARSFIDTSDKGQQTANVSSACSRGWCFRVLRS